MLAKERIIVALDVDHPDRAFAFVVTLKDVVGSFKIGLELITALLASILVDGEAQAMANAHLIRELFRLLRGRLFYDGKLHDIPNTIGAAVKIIGQAIGATMFDVHASSGVDGMRAAVANKGRAKVLAVTVLTSHEENNEFLIFGAPSKAKVLQFARDAQLPGADCDGIVCSPQELLLLDAQPELSDLLRVVPGIRSSEDPADDQKRTMSPGEAIIAGANFLVIGRPITKTALPIVAAQRIGEEIRKALVHRFFLQLFKLENIKFGEFRLKLHETNPDAPLSPIYLNIRQLPDRLYALAGDILHDLADYEGIGDFDYVAGIPKAGEPIGQALAKAVGKPHLRLEKSEGDGVRRVTATILDPFEKGKGVVVVDDLLTKAHTKLEAVKALEENGLRVVAILVLCDREQGGLEELRAADYKVFAAATISEVLALLASKGRISQDQMAKVLTYIAAN